MEKWGFRKIYRLFTREYGKGDFCRIEGSLYCEGEDRDFCPIERPLHREGGERGIFVGWKDDCVMKVKKGDFYKI